MRVGPPRGRPSDPDPADRWIGAVAADLIQRLGCPRGFHSRWFTLGAPHSNQTVDWFNNMV